MFSKITLLSLVPALVLSAPSCPAPNPPTPPTGRDCGGLHYKWTLSDLKTSAWYTFVSPSASGPKDGRISFKFANDQVAWTASCSGASNNPQGIFYGHQIFDCFTEGGEAWKKTSFSYDTATNAVNVNSTWACPGGDVVYTHIGSGKADLGCATDRWENPDWQSGELYSNTTTTCGPTTLIIKL